MFTTIRYPFVSSVSRILLCSINVHNTKPAWFIADVILRHPAGSAHSIAHIVISRERVFVRVTVLFPCSSFLILILWTLTYTCNPLYCRNFHFSRILCPLFVTEKNKTQAFCVLGILVEYSLSIGMLLWITKWVCCCHGEQINCTSAIVVQ